MCGIVALKVLHVYTHQLTNVAVKGIAVVGRLVSVVIILLDDYEIVSNS